MILLWKAGIISPARRRAVSRSLGRQKSIAVLGLDESKESHEVKSPLRIQLRSIDLQSVRLPVVPTGVPETAVGTTAGHTDWKSMLRLFRGHSMRSRCLQVSPHHIKTLNSLIWRRSPSQKRWQARSRNSPQRLIPRCGLDTPEKEDLSEGNRDCGIIGGLNAIRVVDQYGFDRFVGNSLPVWIHLPTSQKLRQKLRPGQSRVVGNLLAIKRQRIGAGIVAKWAVFVRAIPIPCLSQKCPCGRMGILRAKLPVVVVRQGWHINPRRCPGQRTRVPDRRRMARN